MESERNPDRWGEFSWRAMAVKIMNPKIDLNLNRESWDGMRKFLEFARELENYDTFSKHAAAMKILAAEKVEVTDQGLNIAMPKKKKSLKSNVPPMPETKKF